MTTRLNMPTDPFLNKSNSPVLVVYKEPLPSAKLYKWVLLEIVRSWKNMTKTLIQTHLPPGLERRNWKAQLLPPENRLFQAHRVPFILPLYVARGMTGTLGMAVLQEKEVLFSSVQKSPCYLTVIIIIMINRCWWEEITRLIKTKFSLQKWFISIACQSTQSVALL